jgi:RNA polymerase sigma factor (sigma-70 family)
MPPTETTEPRTDAPRDLRPGPSRAEIDPAALEIVRRHGGEVLAVARRWADTPEDAEDAYQRGLEIMLTKAPSTDPDHLVPWLKTVVKREAWAIRRQRERHTPSAPEADDVDTPGFTSAHDDAVTRERLQVGAEAMHRLKPQEVRALVLKAEGLSYREICEETGWTYTKVNRCLTEGRRRFADRLAGIESGAECDRLAPQLSALADGEARAEDMALLRPHLRTCLVCRARLRDYRAAPAKVAALYPPVAAGGLIAALRELTGGASGWFAERAAALSLRWHQAAELAAGHKVAAVVASTAALAGGGAATVAGVSDGETRRAPVAAPAAPTTPEPPARAAAAAATPAASRDDERGERRAPARAAAPRASGPPSDTSPAAPPAQAVPPPAAGEFTPDAPAAPRAQAPPRSEPKPPPPNRALLALGRGLAAALLRLLAATLAGHRRERPLELLLVLDVDHQVAALLLDLHLQLLLLAALVRLQGALELRALAAVDLVRAFELRRDPLLGQALVEVVNAAADVSLLAAAARGNHRDHGRESERSTDST